MRRRLVSTSVFLPTIMVAEMATFRSVTPYVLQLTTGTESACDERVKNWKGFRSLTNEAS
jgi:hypothetical protein